MGKNQPKNKDLDAPATTIKKYEGEKITIESAGTMHTHGGKLWDSLFILIKDNDKQFIYDFCSRIPCETCKNDFIIKLNNKDLENKTREELLQILWQCRGDIHDKYRKKSLLEYLQYLKMI